MEDIHSYGQKERERIYEGKSGGIMERKDRGQCDVQKESKRIEVGQGNGLKEKKRIIRRIK